MLATHPDVAGQHEVEPVSDGKAVNHGYGGHLHLMEFEGHTLGTAADELVNLVGFHVAQQPVACLSLLLDVGGGAKCPPRAGQHQRPHILVSGHVLQCRVQLPEHLPVQGIKVLRPVKGDPCHVVFLFENDGLVSQFCHSGSTLV